jgi:hypothetical protein
VQQRADERAAANLKQLVETMKEQPEPPAPVRRTRTPIKAKATS